MYDWVTLISLYLNSNCFVPPRTDNAAHDVAATVTNKKKFGSENKNMKFLIKIQTFRNSFDLEKKPNINKITSELSHLKEEIKQSKADGKR